MNAGDKPVTLRLPIIQYFPPTQPGGEAAGAQKPKRHRRLGEHSIEILSSETRASSELSSGSARPRENRGERKLF